MSRYKQFTTFRRTTAPSSSVSALFDDEDEKRWEIFTDWLILALQKTSVFFVAFLCPAFLSVIFICLYCRCFCPPASCLSFTSKHEVVVRGQQQWKVTTMDGKTMLRVTSFQYSPEVRVLLSANNERLIDRQTDTHTHTHTFGIINYR